jgi:hypothetical protein
VFEGPGIVMQGNPLHQRILAASPEKLFSFHSTEKT